MGQDRKMVRVACLVPNGYMIRLSKPGFDDGTGDGARPTVHDGPGVRLNGPSALNTGAGSTESAEPGVTEVDAGWFDRWLKQHELDPVVTMDQVYVLDDGEPKDPNPTTA